MPPELSEEELKKLQSLVALLDERSRPNINALAELVRNIPLMALNIKTLGYELGRALWAALPERSVVGPRHIGITCKPSTQEDLESDWVAYWASQLQIPVFYHRKVWELAYVLQALYEEGCIKKDRRGVGFGCGVEAIPSYLASHGVHVTVTDLPPDTRQHHGWEATDQHTASLKQAFHAHLIDRDRFDALVSHRFVDMNAIPDDLVEYDFCWSICAMEHIGSIEKGMAFVENALKALCPGGVAVHTTEFNFLNDAETIDNWSTVLPQRRHFEELAKRLQQDGHVVAPLDFNVGTKPLDRFIDLPPFAHDLPAELRPFTEGPHIKVATDGFASTCFGLTIRKADSF